MVEVRLAAGNGYRMLEMYEMYEYQVTEYNPKTGEVGLLWTN